jgi:hypothetical protein
LCAGRSGRQPTLVREAYALKLKVGLSPTGFCTFMPLLSKFQFSLFCVLYHLTDVSVFLFICISIPIFFKKQKKGNSHFSGRKYAHSEILLCQSWE